MELWQQFCMEWMGYLLPCETPCNHCALVEDFAVREREEWNGKHQEACLQLERDFYLKGYLAEFIALMQDDIDCGKVTQTVTRFNLIHAARQLLAPEKHTQPYVGDPQELPDVP